MPQACLVNGQSHTTIELADRGLQYGDGLFTTIAIQQGQALFWEAHMQRLQSGCQRLNLVPPNLSLLQHESQFLLDKLAQTSVNDAVLKILITRGQGGRGYCPPQRRHNTRILSLYPWPEYPLAYWHAGIETILCRTQLAINPSLAGIKHLNRLENVLASHECAQHNVAEGILCDSHGMPVCGTKSNLFLRCGENLITPALDHCGVAGVLRDVIIRLAGELGIKVMLGTVGRAQLLAANEVFLTNSIIGLWPVKKIDQTNYQVGALTRKLMSELFTRFGFNSMKRMLCAD